MSNIQTEIDGLLDDLRTIISEGEPIGAPGPIYKPTEAGIARSRAGYPQPEKKEPKRLQVYKSMEQLKSDSPDGYDVTYHHTAILDLDLATRLMHPDYPNDQEPKK